MDNDQLSAIFLGRSGTGKSKICNSIIGNEEDFLYAPSGCNVTKFCTSKTVTRFGVSLTMVDTKGIARLSENDSVNVQTIEEGLQELASGASALILCMKMDRLEDELEVLKFLEKNIGNGFIDYAVVVFTHLDQWEEKLREKMQVHSPIKEFLLTLPEDMKTFLHNIKDRYMAFNNRLTGEEMDLQIQSLIMKIKQVRDHNHGQTYSLKRFYATRWMKSPLITERIVTVGLGGLSVVLAVFHYLR